MARGEIRVRGSRALVSSAAGLSAPPPKESPAADEPLVTMHPEDALCVIFRRLTHADLLPAALACRSWRRAAIRALPRAPPLLGYLFHPANTPGKPPASSLDKTFYPAVFAPIDASSPHLCLALSPSDARGFSITDVHLGLVLLVPRNLPKAILPRVLVIDPASRRRAMLPSPPRDTLPDDHWRSNRRVFGVAVLSRAHPSRLSFDAVLFSVDGDRPRAWLASVRDGDCTWRAMPRAKDVQVDFNPYWFENRCVHSAGNIYWHFCNGSRALKLDALTLDFSFIPVPAVLGDTFKSYRIGETVDGRLCIVVMVDEELQIWVRGEPRWSDRGWLLATRMSIRKVIDTIPGIPSGGRNRYVSTWFTDMDYACTGKVFVGTWGYGRYSFLMETGLRLAGEDTSVYQLTSLWCAIAFWPTF